MTLVFFISFSNCTKSKDTQKTLVQTTDKILRFQPGRMGFKPWVNQSSYTATATFNKAVFKQLLYLKRDFSIEPGIFKSWKWDPKASTYFFEVDTDLQFGKGRKIKLQDIEFAILKSFLIETDISQNQFLMDIKCDKKLAVGMKFRTGMCSGVNILPPDKISITLRKSNPTFLYRLGELMPPVAPEEDFGPDMETFRGIPRGTGKYFVSFSDDKTSEIVLSLKEQYLSDPSYSKAPTKIHFFNHGDAITNKADLTTNAGNSALKDNKEYAYIVGQIPKVINVLDFNFLNRHARDLLFRKAVGLAIDRSKILGDSGKLIAATGLISSSYGGYQKRSYEYSPDQAKEIVKKHFSKISSPGKPLKAYYHGPADSPKKSYIITIENQLRDIGLYFDFKPSTHIYFDKSSQDTVFYIYGLVTSYVDPLNPFTNYVNIGHEYHNHDRKDMIPEKLYAAAQITENKKRQIKLIDELQKYFREKYVQLPLQEAFPSFRANEKIESIGIDDVFYTLDLSRVKMKVQ